MLETILAKKKKKSLNKVYWVKKVTSILPASACSLNRTSECSNMRVHIREPSLWELQLVCSFRKHFPSSLCSHISPGNYLYFVTFLLRAKFWQSKDVHEIRHTSNEPILGLSCVTVVLFPYVGFYKVSSLPPLHQDVSSQDTGDHLPQYCGTLWLFLPRLQNSCPNQCGF